MFGKEKKPTNRLSKIWDAKIDDHVIDLDWSSDGSQLAAAAISGPIVLFNRQGVPQHTLPGHKNATSAIAFHPKESVIASVGQDKHLRIWDTQLGQQRAAFEAGAAWVDRVAWSADGRFLAASAGKIVRVWDFTTGEQVREFGPHASTVADIAWHPGQHTLAVAVYGGIAIYDLTPENKNELSWKGSPLVLAWSPDGKMLVHGNQDASVHFWYVARKHDLHMSGYVNKVRELSWDFTGRYLATGGGPAVCIWDCSGKGPENTTPQILEAHENRVTTVRYQRRGYLVASGDANGRACVWQPANRQSLIGAVTFENTEISTSNWSRDDKQLAIGSSSGVLGVFEIR